MKYGSIGSLIPMLLDKPAYGYTKEAVPELDMKAFRKEHRKEYKAMVARTPGVGSMKDNMFTMVMYLACYGFS